MMRIPCPINEKYPGTKFLILGEVPGRSPIRWYWRCECGYEGHSAASSIRNNSSSSCGFCRHTIKIGDKQGSLIVTKLIGLRKSPYKSQECRNYQIEVECHGTLYKSCGVKFTIPIYQWKNGQSYCKSCSGHVSHALRPYEARYHLLVRSAEERGINCEIKYEDYCNLLGDKRCHYCNVAISIDPIMRYKGSPSGYYVNRIDVDKKIGYVLSNVTVCCSKCNLGPLTTYSHDEWYELAAPLRKQNE